MIHHRTIWLCVLLVAAMSGCDINEIPPAPVRDNPLDEGGDNYQPPQVMIVSGPADRSVLDTHTVRFVWRNRFKEEFSLFSYRRDDGEWSGYDTVRSVTYEHLEEGNFRFQVRSRYMTGQVQEVPTAVNLVVNAVKGPAFRAAPRKITVNRQASFSLDLIGEELPVCAGVKIVVRYDPKRFRLMDSVNVIKDTRSILARGGGSIIDFVERNETAGTMTLTAAVAGGIPDSINGTGTFARILFTATGGTAATDTIFFERTSTVRTVDNTVIPLRHLVPAIVEVR